MIISCKRTVLIVIVMKLLHLQMSHFPLKKGISVSDGELSISLITHNVACPRCDGINTA